MRKSILLLLPYLFLMIFSCSETIEPEITTGTTQLNITLNNVGELSKASEIQLADLYIHMNKGALNVHDTISLNGNAEVLVSQSYVDMSEGLWSVHIESKDATGEVIHADSTTFTVLPDYTIDVDLTLISKYSMLIANFNGITDGVYRCELLLNEVMVADSSFTPQDVLDFNITLGYDYLATGESHTISLDAYGEYESTEYLFYTCDTTIDVVAGEDMTYALEMLWVGPYGALEGNAVLEVIIGASGTINMNAEFPIPGDVLEDIDGNLYNTVLIGNQIWMAENLKVTHYRNGDTILYIDDVDWPSTAQGARWDGRLNPYGIHYNWYAIADSRSVAPLGWHVPSAEEWQSLINHLGGNDVAGGKLKEEGINHWASENVGATNETEFTALPAGELSYTGVYYGEETEAFFWTTSQPTDPDGLIAYSYHLTYSSTGVSLVELDANLGASIRCVKDS